LTTKLITDDGKKVYIPNQVIFNAPFFNITASPQRRIIMDFEIPIGEDITKAKQAVLDDKIFEHVDKTDSVNVIFTSAKQECLQCRLILAGNRCRLWTAEEPGNYENQ
jgi:small conductance mechanosensitive channel